MADFKKLRRATNADVFVNVEAVTYVSPSGPGMSLIHFGKEHYIKVHGAAGDVMDVLWPPKVQQLRRPASA